MYRFSRNFNADDLPSFALPPQLVDPSLRGGDSLFPNLRVGKFGREALTEDLTPYRVAKMFRPDVINMTSTNPARQAKALEDIQFQKAGQSPGQAKALGELIRKDPTLGNSFNVGYGSTLNREQGVAQKEGRVYEFDPTDEMWKLGFKRKNPDIVAMSDLRDALMTMPSGSRLTTYDGRPLDPAFTKAYYNLEATQDINDPQLFYNLKGKSDVDYGRIAQALNSIPLDKTRKTDYSLAKRWERVQGYSPYPPRGATYVLNTDKPYQTIDEIMADVDQVEPWRTPRMADARIARSGNMGSADLNVIPKDYTRKEYLEATGDSDNLPDLPYSDYSTATRLFGNLLGDKRGDYIPKYQFTDESNLIGREIGEDNARIAYEPSDEWLRLARLANSGDIIGTSQRSTKYPVKVPIEDRRVYRKAGELNIEDRDFLLSSPVTQLPIRASASILPPNYLGADRQFGYYGNNRDIPTSLSAIEEGLTGRKGSIVGYVDARRKQRPTTRLEREEVGADYFNPYTQDYARGVTNLSDNLYLQNFSLPNSIAPARLAWGEGGLPLASTLAAKESYLRIPEKRYVVAKRDNIPFYENSQGEPIYTKEFYSPEVILPTSLMSRVQQYSGNMGYSPNNYRKATLEGRDVNDLDITKLSRREAAKLKDVGFYEFNDIMDEGVRTSKDVDRLYELNDELAYLSDIARKDDMYADILGYEHSNVIDKIVEAERKQQDMGGTYRALTGTQDQGSFEQERMAYEGRPSALTQYNINDVLEPSFGGDYSGRTNTGRIRVAVGTEYDAGIPVGATVKARIANPVIGPIQLDDPTVEPFNVAQYNRDLIDRGRVGLNHVHGTSELMGNILIDTQLGIPIVKAPTSSFNPKTQRNESYLQPVRPSRVVDNPLPWGPIDNTANWQAPESLAIGRVGKGIAVRNIPELSTNTGMSVERRASLPVASLQQEILNNRITFPNPLPKKTLYIDGINYGKAFDPSAFGF